MPVFIGFLRAVNIGKRQYPMAELRAALEAAGFTDVATHIQTGNVRVATRMRSTEKVAAALERAFEEDRGFPVPTVVLTQAEVVALTEDIDELAAEHRPGYGHYVSLLKEQPTAAQAEALEAASLPGERVLVRGRAVHQLYDVPYGEAKTASAPIPKGLVATNRNAKVIRAVKEKWT